MPRHEKKGLQTLGTSDDVAGGVTSPVCFLA